jgi:hypothetical protein
MVGRAVQAVHLIDQAPQTAIAAIDVMPVERPLYLAGAVALAFAGTGLDLVKTRLEKKFTRDLAENQGLKIAAPAEAEDLEKTAKRTAFRNGLAYYAGATAAAFGLVHAAGPYTDHSELKDAATIVINAGNDSEPEDMKGFNGQPTTRLVATIEGSLAAAKANKAPFSFVINGDTSRAVDSTPATNKDLKRTIYRINQALTYQMRNGSASQTSGAEEALPLAPEKSNNIILATSKIDPKDKASFKELILRIRREHPEDKVRVVVVGNGIGNYQVGTTSLTSPTDKQSFIELLGEKNVKTAESSQQVKDDIHAFMGESEVIEHRSPINTYGYVAIGSALLTIGLVAKRRLSGIFGLRKVLNRSK